MDQRMTIEERVERHYAQRGLERTILDALAATGQARAATGSNASAAGTHILMKTDVGAEARKCRQQSRAGFDRTDRAHLPRTIAGASAIPEDLMGVSTFADQLSSPSPEWRAQAIAHGHSSFAANRTSAHATESRKLGHRRV